MNKKFFYLLFIFFLLIPFSTRAKVLDRVVGIVDGEVITISDLDEAMAGYGKANAQEGGNPVDREMRLSQARKEILEKLIEEKLLQKASLGAGIKVKDEEVEKIIERLKREGRMTDAQMEKELASQGFALEGYRHFLKVQIIKTRIIEYFIKPNISIDEEKIREYYHRHIKQYQRPAHVRVSQILIRVPNTATTEELKIAKEKMERVCRRLQEGANFEEVALQYSEDPSARSGGDLGYFKKGEMIPAFEEVIFDMEVGEVSGVIKSSHGLHLLKVTERKEGDPIPYGEIEERVEKDCYRAELERLYAKWLQDIRNRSNVDVKF
jgi:peptidyl-prolyl cis-trans isomerase SurA